MIVLKIREAIPRRGRQGTPGGSEKKKKKEKMSAREMGYDSEGKRDKGSRTL